MKKVQNLDVHETFGVSEVRSKNSLYINEKAIQSNGGNGLANAGRADHSGRYEFDLQSKSHHEHCQIPRLEGLSISEGSSAACQQEETQ